MDTVDRAASPKQSFERKGNGSESTFKRNDGDDNAGERRRNFNQNVIWQFFNFSISF